MEMAWRNEKLGPALALHKIGDDRDVDIFTFVSFDRPNDGDHEVCHANHAPDPKDR